MVSSSSGGSRRYRGVRQRQWGSWVSEIRHSISKTRIWLGTFDTAKKAAKAYDEAARVMEGENAKTNFPLPSPSSSSLLSPSVRAKLMHCNCMATLRGPTNNYNVMTNNNHMKYNASSGTSGHITKFKASKVTSYTNNSHKHKDEQYNDGYRSHGGSMTMTSGAHVYTNGHHDPRTLSSDGRYGNGRTLGSKSGAGQYRGQTLVCLRLDDAADRLGVMWQGSADSKPQWVTTIHVPPPPPLPQVHSMTLSSTTISTTNSNIFGSSSSSFSSSSDSDEAPKHDIYSWPKNSSCPADQVSPTISSSSSTTTSMVSTGNLDILLDATFDFSGHIPTTPRTTLLLPNHSPPTSCYEDEDDSMMMDHIDLIDLIYDSPQLGASPNLDILDNHHHHHHHDGGDDMALMDPLQLGAEASISQALLYLAQAGVEEEDHHHHHHRHNFHQNQLDDDEDDGEHMYHHHHHHHHNPFPFLEEYNCHEEEDQLWQ